MSGDQQEAIDPAAGCDGARWVPHTRIQRASTKAMLRSAGIPQFTLQRKVRIDDLKQLREEIRAAGSPASLSDLLTACAARALRSHPLINASYRDNGILVYEHINIGLAWSTPRGLMVACILDTDKHSLRDIAVERRHLKEAVDSGSLTKEQLFNTTFTISNLGPYGIDCFTALVNPPQAAILAVPAPTTAVTSKSRGIGLTSVLHLSLTCDHRAIDGAPAADFLGTLSNAIESPGWLRAPMYSS